MLTAPCAAARARVPFIAVPARVEELASVLICLAVSIAQEASFTPPKVLAAVCTCKMAPANMVRNLRPPPKISAYLPISASISLWAATNLPILTATSTADAPRLIMPAIISVSGSRLASITCARPIKLSAIFEVPPAALFESFTSDSKTLFKICLARPTVIGILEKAAFTSSAIFGKALSNTSEVNCPSFDIFRSPAIFVPSSLARRPAK